MPTDTPASSPKPVSDGSERLETSADGRPDAAQKPAGPDALAAVFKQLAEAVEYLAYLLATQVDRVKLKVRNLIVLAVLGVLAAAAGTAIVFCTFWLLLSGIAGGIGELLGDRPWLGGIVTAGFILIVGASAGWIFYRKWKSGGLKSTRRRYEQRQAKQQARFGREVEQVAEKAEGSKQ